ncbi:DUF4282 domain-containing protein [Pasteurellaceae bacterium USgator11]|nr:DUF4282 domain-containing protein [Pasteurellaceae bacterium UScroc12]TNG96651.1 DUF4282 domain-containing protein [Pasteurellaceae bacterium USgator41]TNG98886.1 DUF4282 domain-containing protein [Pasteurellaceae bacterium UScroc31]TNG99505.1 DUF4282 domain-containing protein [Pasteurellaceae bacterium USgator11]
MSVKDFFIFDKLITPKIITIIYWILMIVSVISGLETLVVMSYYSMLTAIIYGGLIIILGILFARIFCELILVIFKINTNLEKLNKSDIEENK